MTQRPIKFRIAITSPHWDENPGSTKLSEPLTLGEIIDHEQIDFEDGGYLTWDQIDWETDTVRYLQFTGLHDKSESPIYESDVVVLEGLGQINNWEVQWVGDHWGLVNGHESYDNGDYYHGSDISWPSSEVIGNIIENGDLLNAQA